MTLKDAVEGFEPTTEAEAALKDLVIVLGEMTEALHREFPGAGELLYQRSGGLMTVAVQAATRMRTVTKRQQGDRHAGLVSNPLYVHLESLRNRVAAQLMENAFQPPSRSDELVHAQPRPLFGQSRELVKS